jgi:hypothetical protein
MDIWNDIEGTWIVIGTRTFGPFTKESDAEAFGTAAADLDRISAWLAEDTDNDEAQGAASDLNAAREVLLGTKDAGR